MTCVSYVSGHLPLYRAMGGWAYLSFEAVSNISLLDTVLSCTAAAVVRFRTEIGYFFPTTVAASAMLLPSATLRSSPFEESLRQLCFHPNTYYHFVEGAVFSVTEFIRLVKRQA
jgi:hypothetical protein